MGLSADELAFYDALAQSASAVQVRDRSTLEALLAIKAQEIGAAS
jgi:hypothetical protein